MPRSAISHARTFCGSAPSTGANVVIAVGSSSGSTTRQPLTSASAVAGHPADLGQPVADLLRPGGQMLTERNRIAHARSDIRLAVFEALHHRYGRPHSGGGSRGLSRCARSGRIARKPTPRGPAIHLRDEL